MFTVESLKIKKDKENKKHLYHDLKLITSNPRYTTQMLGDLGQESLGQEAHWASASSSVQRR